MATESSATKMSYEKAGVSIRTADAAKEQMAEHLKTSNPRVLNKFGAFGSLVDGHFEGYKHPVLVLKMEEPGTKPLLAAAHGRLDGIAYDLVNHLINDVVVMGAKPVAILDTIVCGKLEKETVVKFVKAIADACRAQHCDLVGGETSEQPRVIPSGTYIFSAAAVGVVDKEKIIDGATISAGDQILAVASNGLHTNGYTLIRSLLDADSKLAELKLSDGTRFIDAVLEPHLCYNLALQEVFARTRLTGLAHITGGGIAGNLIRVLPEEARAVINLNAVEILPVFKAVKAAARGDDADLLQSLNLGVGLVIVLPKSSQKETIEILSHHGHRAYPIGEIQSGKKEVSFSGSLGW